MAESTPREHRRSTRVPLNVAIAVEGQTDRTCEGTTEIVSLHGALIHTAKELPYGNIHIHVICWDDSSISRVSNEDRVALRVALGSQLPDSPRRAPRVAGTSSFRAQRIMVVSS